MALLEDFILDNAHQNRLDVAREQFKYSLLGHATARATRNDHRAIADDLQDDSLGDLFRGGCAFLGRWLGIRLNIQRCSLGSNGGIGGRKRDRRYSRKASVGGVNCLQIGVLTRHDVYNLTQHGIEERFAWARFRSINGNTRERLQKLVKFFLI